MFEGLPDSKNKKNLFTEVSYSQIIESLEDYAIFTTSKENIITSWNAGSEKIFGFREDEIIGKPVSLLFTEEDIKNKVPVKETEIALKEGRSIDERWHLKKDKARFFAFGLTFPLKDKDGKFIGFVKISRDLTERKKSEEALNKYSKELEKLNLHKEKIVSVLSHDLRSPLNSIIGTSDILFKNLEVIEKPDMIRMLSIINKSATKILDMLDNLVDWAKAKYANDTFSPEAINLSGVIRSAFSLLEENAAQKSIKFLNKVMDNIYVQADEKMLFSVMQNLFSNAIKYSNPGGEVTTTAMEEEGKIVVNIEDCGIGMSKDLTNNIFNPGPSVSTKGTEGEKGAGIGFLLIREFIEKNGGEIWIESEEGKGTKITFSLPKAI